MADKRMQPRDMLSTTTSTSSTKTSHTLHCTPFTLPSGGHLLINPSSTLTLTTNVLFTPECNPSSTASATFDDSGISGITDVKDPFHASVTPQVYATAAATVIAWMLVIMLLITPRTYFVGGAGGGFGILNRHGMIGGAQGSASVIGVGSRPWLQKVAALTVAVSLTIATADTFEVAEQQYSTGFMNAEQLRSQVVNSTEIKATRVISDIFLWLAQVQTLIRLFSKHREKVLIKWIGFALIILNATFSTLNSFMGNPVGRPKEFRDAIPALSYLFQLALSMLYAAWVMYYAFCKRKYAFYHKDMWNITIVAILSFVAIFTPVVFFTTDIANQSIAGWGDYFRWVGAAAASVIVWEWVERIEALEREEKKDGILGREVFDGDDMLDSVESEEVIWPRPRGFWAGQGFKHRGGNRRGGGGAGGSAAGAFTSGQDIRGSRLPMHRGQASRALGFVKSRTKRSPERAAKESDVHLPYTGINPIPTPPPAAVSPISRADTTSAASTVYTIRYHNINTPIPPTVRPQNNFASLNNTMQNNRTDPTELDEKQVIDDNDDEESIDFKADDARSKFHINNPFKRKRVLPPQEVRAGRVIDPVSINGNDNNVARSQQLAHSYRPWDLKGRVSAFAAEQGEKWRERAKHADEKERDLPVTIIPAQPRGRTWSPDATLNLPTTVEEIPPRTPGTAGGLTFDSAGPTAVGSAEPSPGQARGGFAVDPLPAGGFASPPGTAEGAQASRPAPELNNGGSHPLTPPPPPSAPRSP